MFYLTTEMSFDAAHFLKDYNGKCRNLHGHRWRVIAKIAKEELEKAGQLRSMVIDFGDLKDALKEVTDYFDHSLIYEKDSLKPKTLEALIEEEFVLREVPFRPTAEEFSRYFFNQLKNQGFPVKSLTVYETPGNCATYEE
ncbi:Queuosine biosynthesis QueD, PTPS-I [Lachnospiraceae bacterium TWA4]|nr:Queuosine biosynthesis QueD, PTPS-I [Lachnospiraceae bacterium TWA4]